MLKQTSALRGTLCGISLSLVALSTNAMVPEDASHTYHTNSVNHTAHADQPAPFFNDEIIILYKNDAAAQNASSVRMAASQMVTQAASVATGMSMQYERATSNGAHVVSMSSKSKAPMTNAELQALLNKLNKDPNVLYAEPNTRMYAAATPSDPRYNELWHYYEATGGLNTPPAWDISTGAGTVVAILDTGITSHPDLNANVLPGYDMISSARTANDGNGRDSDPLDTGDAVAANECGAGSRASGSSWHGTHVAGTVAAVANNGTGIAGVAYDAKLLPVRVLGKCGGSTADIADAMIWAAGGRVPGVPVNPNPAQVINLSLGGGGSCGRTTQNAIDTAVRLGATVVVAAGNSNVDARNATPANCRNVVTVAATGRSGGKASYSNFGANVDVAAPGGDQRTGRSDGVLSTLNTGRSGPAQPSYAYYQGTSMATPHVAGAAALLYAVKPDISPAEVETALTETARRFPNRCNACGSGIVDAEAALLAVAPGGGNPQPDPEPEPTPISRVDLENGVQLNNLSMSQGGEIRGTIDVPEGATDLAFLTGFGQGNADLYVRFGEEPTAETFDCRSAQANNNRETCRISDVQGGTYHVLILAEQAFSGLSTVVRFEEPAAEPDPTPAPEVVFSRSNLGWASGMRRGSFNVPADAKRLIVTMSGGSGNADLGVRPAGTSRYSCVSVNRGTNNESCVVENPRGGAWQIAVLARSRFSGANLTIAVER